MSSPVDTRDSVVAIPNDHTEEKKQKNRRVRTKPKNKLPELTSDASSTQTSGSLEVRQKKAQVTKPAAAKHAPSRGGGDAAAVSTGPRKPLNFAPPAAFNTKSKAPTAQKKSISSAAENVSADRTSRPNDPPHTTRVTGTAVDLDVQPNSPQQHKPGPKFAPTADPFPSIDSTLVEATSSLSLDDHANTSEAKAAAPASRKKDKQNGKVSLADRQQSSAEPRKKTAGIRARRDPRARTQKEQLPASILDRQAVTRGKNGRFVFEAAQGHVPDKENSPPVAPRSVQRDQYAAGPGVVAQEHYNREADEALLSYQKTENSTRTVGTVGVSSRDGKKAVNGNVRTSRSAYYEEHITKEEGLQGLKDGKYLLGILRISQKARQDGWVTVKSELVVDGEALIEGEKHRNRALNGDEVILELILPATDGQQSESPPNGEAAQKHEGRTRAKVVHIYKQRPLQRISGFIRPPGYVYGLKKQDERALIANQGNQSSCMFHPQDGRIPWLTISKHDLPKEMQGPNWIFNVLQKQRTIFAARIVTWQAAGRTPRGTIVDELGTVGNIVAETAAILADCDVDVRDHPMSALQCLPATPWSISAEEVAKRRDFRKVRVCTIDPETARDLDDALSVRKLDDDKYEIGVHIADVSHFIEQDNALDKIARERATTVYMVQKAIPMLPRLLCEELCSLNPAVDRLAFSVTWTLNEDGEEVGPRWYGRSIIRSAVRFAYGEAQNLLDGKSWAEGVGKPIDGGHTEAEITEDVKVLLRMSKAMRARRFEKGALTINAFKLNFKLNKDGLPGVAEVYQLKDANRLIEEFMLKANISVAEKIVASFPEHALLRQHPPPKDRPLKEFVNYAAKLGVHIDASSSANLQDGFNALAAMAKDNPVVSVLQNNAVKSMQKALYMCTGLHEDQEEWAHYALAVPLYTHFTSPIRRYADVIVHRLLDHALKQEAAGFEADDCEEWAKNCNVRKENARLAQDRSSMLYLCAYIEEHCRNHNLVGTDMGMFAEAVVISVKDRSMDVIVTGMALESRVYYDDSFSISTFIHDQASETVEVCWRSATERLDAIRKEEETTDEEGVEAASRPKSNRDKNAKARSANIEDGDSAEEINAAGTEIVPSATGMRTNIGVMDKVQVWLRGDFDVSPCQVKIGLVSPKE